MATTQATANPKKKSSGFQGVRDAIWIIVACFNLAVCFFKDRKSVGRERVC